MSQEDGTPDRVVGLPVAEAVDVVVARNDGLDEATARAALHRVAEDGVVSQDAVDETLTDASMAVSTAETRTEFAAMALSDAEETAADVADLDAVRSRLDAFASRLADVEDRASAVGPDLQDLVARSDEPGGVYAVASGTRTLVSAANDVQRTADDLQMDVDEFERWVGSQDARFRELDGDVDALEASVGDLTDAIDDLAADVESATTDEEAGGSAGATGGTGDGGRAWLDVSFQHLVQNLVLADVRAELEDLRTWADREDIGDAERTAAVETRLADLESRLAAADDRLDDVARPAWRERFGDRLSAFEAALDGFEPPVDWADVQAAVEEHRPG